MKPFVLILLIFKIQQTCTCLCEWHVYVCNAGIKKKTRFSRQHFSSFRIFDLRIKCAKKWKKACFYFLKTKQKQAWFAWFDLEMSWIAHLAFHSKILTATIMEMYLLLNFPHLLGLIVQLFTRNPKSTRQFKSKDGIVYLGCLLFCCLHVYIY